jgi:nucleotide-binding universal stress UspA family protein
MKKILVPIDFSHNSLKTLDYVIENFKNAAIEVILVWINNARSKDVLVRKNDGDIEKAATEQLKNIVAEYSPKLEHGKITHRIREGKVHIEIANQAKYDNVDLLVCGTHGASGFEADYVGSNAYRIVMYCQCPVITVRPNYRFRASSSIIVLPIDSSADTRQKVPFTCKLAKIINAEIHILGLYSSRLSTMKRRVNSYVVSAEKFIHREGIKYQTFFRDADNVTKTTIAYAEEVDADMISIMTEQETSAWSFLLGTYAEQMIGSSEIPVLSITPTVLTSSTIS